MNSSFNTHGYEIIDGVLSKKYRSESYDYFEVIYHNGGNALASDVIDSNIE